MQKNPDSDRHLGRSTDSLSGADIANEPKLTTLDHRHFGTMRPRHVEALELLPVGG